MTLPFDGNTASPPARPDERPKAGARNEAPSVDPGMSAAQRHLLRQSIALITAMLPGDGGDDLLPAVLADQGADEMLGLTATTAWLASALIKQFEGIAPGAAEAWLQGMAIELAKQGDGPQHQYSEPAHDLHVGPGHNDSSTPPHFSGRDRGLHRLCLAGHAAEVAGDLDAPSGRFWLLHVRDGDRRQISEVLSDVALGDPLALLGHYVVVETRQGVLIHEHCDGDQKPAETRAWVRFSAMQREAQADP